MQLPFGAQNNNRVLGITRDHHAITRCETLPCQQPIPDLIPQVRRNMPNRVGHLPRLDVFPNYDGYALSKVLHEFTKG